MEMPEPMPAGAQASPSSPRSTTSPALSLFARPGDGSIATRRIAIFVADGVDGEAAQALHAGLHRAGRGAALRRRAARAASQTTDGDAIEVEVTFETMPSVLFDAVAVPGGEEGRRQRSATSGTRSSSSRISTATRSRFSRSAPARRSRRERRRPGHAPVGRARSRAARSQTSRRADRGAPDFVKAIARHRHHEREMDPPEVMKRVPPSTQ